MFFSTFDMAMTNWSKTTLDEHAFGAIFLFTLSDSFFPDYVDENGMADLVLWTDSRCAFLVVHAPSKEYFESAVEREDEWLNIIREHGFEHLVNEDVLKINGELETMNDIFSNSRNPFLRNEEVKKVLSYWGLEMTDHPCFIFFRDLSDAEGWLVGLGSLRGLDIAELGKNLQVYFAGKEFRGLLAELEKGARHVSA